MNIEKDKKIKSEIKRLTAILKELDKNTIKGVKSLIENAAFMSVTLTELQDTINLEGPVSEYKNGENQYGTKKSPEVEIYNTMVKNHMAIMRQLTDLLPKTNGVVEDDGFDKFVSRR